MATASKAKRSQTIRQRVAAAPISDKARRQHELLLLLGQLIYTIDDLANDPLIQELDDAQTLIDEAANALSNIASPLSDRYIWEMAQVNFPWVEKGPPAAIG